MFSADITMPSGKRDQPSVEDNHDGTVSLKYDPKEEGLHELFVKYNGENVQGKFIIRHKCVIIVIKDIIDFNNIMIVSVRITIV